MIDDSNKTKSMIDAIDESFAKLFAPIQKTKAKAPIVVVFEGLEWFVYGSYQPAESDVGISAPYFESEKICFALDPDGRNLTDILTQATVDHLESMACGEHEEIERGNKESAIESRAEVQRDNEMTGD